MLWSHIQKAAHLKQDTEPYNCTWVKRTLLLDLTGCTNSTSVAPALADVAAEEGILRKGLKVNEVTVPFCIRGSNQGKIGHLITCQDLAGEESATGILVSWYNTEKNNTFSQFIFF